MQDCMVALQEPQKKAAMRALAKDRDTAWGKRATLDLDLCAKYIAKFPMYIYIIIIDVSSLPKRKPNGMGLAGLCLVLQTRCLAPCQRFGPQELREHQTLQQYEAQMGGLRG